MDRIKTDTEEELKVLELFGGIGAFTKALKKAKIPFEIVDSDYSKIENYEDYMNNNKLKNIIKTVKKIDLNNITFRDAYNILENLKQEIEQIY